MRRRRLLYENRSFRTIARSTTARLVRRLDGEPPPEPFSASNELGVATSGSKRAARRVNLHLGVPHQPVHVSWVVSVMVCCCVECRVECRVENRVECRGDCIVVIASWWLHRGDCIDVVITVVVVTVVVVTVVVGIV